MWKGHYCAPNVMITTQFHTHWSNLVLYQIKIVTLRYLFSTTLARSIRDVKERRQFFFF
jgi:hypothetical protein